jgi:hypothetical protein
MSVIVREVSAKELAKIARESLKMRIAEGLEDIDGEQVIDLSSGELLVRDGDRDIVIKVIVKTKRLEFEIAEEEEVKVEAEPAK